jgi:hypothetical protein
LRSQHRRREQQSGHGDHGREGLQQQQIFVRGRDG